MARCDGRYSILAAILPPTVQFASAQAGGPPHWECLLGRGPGLRRGDRLPEVMG